MSRIIVPVALFFGIVSLVGCGVVDDIASPNDSARPAGPYRTTGLALTADALADTDIHSMEFTVDRVSCKSGNSLGPSESAITDYEDMYLPGGIGAFENKPYDADSQHMFADQYFVLDAGCYDVTTQPLRPGGKKSKDCKSAHKTGVKVKNGKTTEVLLVNQCKGPKRGGLDVAGTINHPPEIDDLVFKDSKFIAQCRPRTQVCVTASDPDDDPLEFQWNRSNTVKYKGGIQSVGQPTYDPQTGQTTACAEVTTGPKGAYGFKVTIFDLDGNGVRIEEVLKQQDPRDAHRSRDTLRFPMYAGVSCQGRSAVILMALSNSPGPRDKGYATPFIQQTAAWVSPLIKSNQSKILVVKDDNDPQNEHPGEPLFITNAINGSMPNLTFLNEPSGGLAPNALDGYDVVWFFNAGWPVDDAASYDELKRFLANGGGMVISGDDTAGPALPGGRSLSYFSHLNYVNNGVTTCGDRTDNNSGNNWRVRFANRSISALTGLRTKTFSYGNDIDHTTRMHSGERPLATGTYTSKACRKQIPVAVSINPIDLP